MHIDHTSFKEIFKHIILKNDNLRKSYSNDYPNKKYKLDDIIEEIIYVLKTGISWRNLRSKINWNTLYQHYCRFVKYNIFHKLFNTLRRKYFKKNKSKIQIVDSSFILNKHGKNKIGRNKFFKNKNGNKISIITDIHGIPLSVFVNKGTIHDIKFMDRHINDCYFVYKTKGNLLLADKAYESKKLRTLLSNNNSQLMVAKKKNAKIEYPFDKKIYKKRIRVENTFQKLKVFRKIVIRYETLFRNYKSFVLLASSILIHNKLF
jgi:transposase